MQAPYKWAWGCVTGASHLVCGAACEDAVASRLVETETATYLVAAVSDGAGSARHGGTGARIAANAFVDLASKSLRASNRSWCSTELQAHAYAAASEVHRVLLRHAARQDADPMQYAATLLAVVTDGWRSAFVQIGDGAIVIGPKWRPVFEPQRGEYANITRFITEPDALAELQVKFTFGRLRSVSLMTDGVEPLVLQHGTVHPPLFDHLSRTLSAVTRRGHIEDLSLQLEELLSGPLVQGRIGDDATLFTLHIAEATP